MQNWAGDHPTEVLCEFPYNAPTPANVAVRNSARTEETARLSRGARLPGVLIDSQKAAVKAQAIQIAKQDYPGYKLLFLYPSDSLMVKSGLWLELEAGIGFIVGLGLASLLGQRTVAVVLMIVLEVILTPILSRAQIAHLINLQRAVVGVATAHLEPSGLPLVFGGGGGGGGPGTGNHFSCRSRPRWPSASSWPGWWVGQPCLWWMMTRDA